MFVVFEGHFLNQFVVLWLIRSKWVCRFLGAVSQPSLPWLEPYLALVLRPLAPLLPTTIAYRGATAKTTNLFRKTTNTFRRVHISFTSQNELPSNDSLLVQGALRFASPESAFFARMDVGGEISRDDYRALQVGLQLGWFF